MQTCTEILTVDPAASEPCWLLAFLDRQDHLLMQARDLGVEVLLVTRRFGIRYLAELARCNEGTLVPVRAVYAGMQLIESPLDDAAFDCIPGTSGPVLTFHLERLLNARRSDIN